MARRKRRRFSGTTEQHHEHSKNTLREVRRLQERLRAHLRAPANCESAVPLALALARETGVYDVHRYEGRGRGLSGGRSIHRANAGLYLKVEKLCTLRPKTKKARREIMAVWR